MKVNKFFRNLLFILFVVYYAQGSFYPQGSVISQSSSFLILLISSFFFLKTLFIKNKDKFYLGWTTLLLLNLLGFIFTGNYLNPLHIGMLRGILTCSLIFYPFYFFAKRNVLKKEDLIVFLIIMLPITILQFYQFENSIVSKGNVSLISSGGSNDEPNLVNNIAYSFVGLIPFVFLIKKSRLLSGGVMLVLMFFIIEGAKRGALIIGAICLIIFFYTQIKSVDKRNKLKEYFISTIAILGLTIFTYYKYSTDQFLMQRMYSISQGNSSGRNIIFSEVFNYWYSSHSIFNLLFGFGFASSLQITGSFAHNDWLELLSNFGLIGIAVYLFLFFALLNFITNKYLKIEKRMVLISIFIIWFLSTIFSMWYLYTEAYLQAIMLGYLIGNRSNKLV